MLNCDVVRKIERGEFTMLNYGVVRKIENSLAFYQCRNILADFIAMPNVTDNLLKDLKSDLLLLSARDISLEISVDEEIVHEFLCKYFC